MGRRNRISRRILWGFGRKSVSLQVLSDSLVGFVADLVGFVVPTKSEIGSLAAPLGFPVSITRVARHRDWVETVISPRGLPGLNLIPKF